MARIGPFGSLRARLLILPLVLLAAASSDRPAPRGGDTERERQTNTANHHRHTQAAQHSAQPAPFVISAQQQAPSENRIAPESQYEGAWYARPDWWIAGFTFALFLATGGLWIFTALLWCETRGAGELNRRSLRIARRSLDQARATSAHELRAYVFVYYTRVKPKESSDKSDRFVRFKYANSGKTPAKNVRVSARAIQVAAGSAVNLTNLPEASLMGPLGPEDERSRDVDIEVRNGSEGAETHLYGRIDYEDEFSRERWTTFHTWSDHTTGKTMHTAKDGNDYR